LVWGGGGVALDLLFSSFMHFLLGGPSVRHCPLLRVSFLILIQWTRFFRTAHVPPLLFFAVPPPLIFFSIGVNSDTMSCASWCFLRSHPFFPPPPDAAVAPPPNPLLSRLFSPPPIHFLFLQLFPPFFSFIASPFSHVRRLSNPRRAVQPKDAVVLFCLFLSLLFLLLQSPLYPPGNLGDHPLAGLFYFTNVPTILVPPLPFLVPFFLGFFFLDLRAVFFSSLRPRYS